MSDFAVLQNSLLVGAILFALGLIGFVTRRNMIVMFLCAEMMLQGVSINLIAWGRYHNDWGGQMLVLFIIAVAACEAGIALALVLLLASKSGGLDAAAWQSIHEEGVAPYIDSQVPEEPLEEDIWPKLTPAGVEPKHDPEKELHRSRV